MDKDIKIAVVHMKYGGAETGYLEIYFLPTLISSKAKTIYSILSLSPVKKYPILNKKNSQGRRAKMVRNKIMMNNVKGIVC